MQGNSCASENAVEVLTVAQHDPTGTPPLGKTKYILINRKHLITKNFEGIKSIQNLFLTVSWKFSFIWRYVAI